MYIVIVYRPKFQSKSWAQYANKVFGEIWGYTFFEKKRRLIKHQKVYHTIPEETIMLYYKEHYWVFYILCFSFAFCVQFKTFVLLKTSYWCVVRLWVFGEFVTGWMVGDWWLIVGW